MFEDWYFRLNGVWKSLPQWCFAYRTIGQNIATRQHNERRLVLGLSTATRAYAAAFVALGTVEQRASECVVSPEADDHFLELCSLEPGTAVSYLDTEDDRLKDAIFEGYEERYDKFYIRIRKNCDHRVDLLPPNFAARVQLSDKKMVKLPKHQRGRLIEENELLTACLGNINPFDYYTKSRLECLVIGNKKLLFEEFEHTYLCVPKQKGGFCEGTLQDVVRVRQLIKDGLGYRASVHSDREGGLPDSKPLPHLVLFDGASGFLKWRDEWRHAHWIVILDRTEARFEEAVNALNRECLENRLDNRAPCLPEPPTHVEALAYEEAR